MIIQNSNGLRQVVGGYQRDRRLAFAYGSKPFPWGMYFFVISSPNWLTMIVPLKDGVIYRYDYSVPDYDYAVKLLQSIFPTGLIPVDGLIGGESYNYLVRQVYGCSKSVF